MQKQFIREFYKQKRNELTAENRRIFSQKIAENTLKLPIWKNNFFHIFLAIEKFSEVQTELIIQVLKQKNKKIIVPKTMFNPPSLKHFLLEEKTSIQINSWGIPEPQNAVQVSENQIDVVFVPLLAFDEFGNRIGYGKGFYDRFLNNCRTDVVKVGLSFFEAHSQKINANSTDIPLDFCVTPNKIYTFGENKIN